MLKQLQIGLSSRFWVAEVRMQRARSRGQRRIATHESSWQTAIHGYTVIDITRSLTWSATYLMTSSIDPGRSIMSPESHNCFTETSAYRGKRQWLVLHVLTADDKLGKAGSAAHCLAPTASPGRTDPGRSPRAKAQYGSCYRSTSATLRIMAASTQCCSLSSGMAVHSSILLPVRLNAVFYVEASIKVS